MRWLKLLDRYSVIKRPTLRVINPRAGTSLIPLGLGDGQILFQYLTNKIHALYFDGSESQLKQLVYKMREEKGFTIEKMKTSSGRGREKLVLLHLRFPDNKEIRRLIKIT